ncbi:MAG: hypothetical protein GWP91_15905 [Rhodobacterales bacterium]|nr:hypothetical protein [Rhodobacterales bacterium]
MLYGQGMAWRGDITICLSPQAIQAWTAVASLKPGGQRRYSDAVIEAALALRLVFRLAFR